MAKFLDDTGLTYLWGKIKTALANKQDTLTAGTNITISNNNTISAKDTKPSGGTYGSNQTADLASGTDWQFSPSGTTSTKIGDFAAGGVYLITIGAQFPSNATGFRGLGMCTSTSTPAVFQQNTTRAVSGATTNIAFSLFMAPSNDTTYYVCFKQNSGSNMTVTY